MSIESSADLEGMRAAGKATRHTLDALESHVRVGVSTAALDSIAAAVFANQGARSAPALVYGFPGNVLISVNDEVVHGVPGPRRQFLTFQERLSNPYRILNQQGGPARYEPRAAYFAGLEMLRAHLHRCLLQVAKIAGTEIPTIPQHMRYSETWQLEAYEV